MLTRFALAAALLSFACGQAADGSSPMEETDASPAAAHDERPSTRARDDEQTVSASVTAKPAPAAETPAPSPTPAHDEQPVPEPATAPAPSNQSDPDPVASDPDPTPEHPLVIDCRPEDCASCMADLRETEPAWYESGAASCQLRACAADGECSSLGDGLVCRPLTEGGKSYCRAPRLALQQHCDPAVVDACEVGLECSGSPARCRPLP